MVPRIFVPRCARDFGDAHGGSDRPVFGEVACISTLDVYNIIRDLGHIYIYIDMAYVYIQVACVLRYIYIYIYIYGIYIYVYMTHRLDSRHPGRVPDPIQFISHQKKVRAPHFRRFTKTESPLNEMTCTTELQKKNHLLTSGHHRTPTQRMS